MLATWLATWANSAQEHVRLAKLLAPKKFEKNVYYFRFLVAYSTSREPIYVWSYRTGALYATHTRIYAQVPVPI